VASLPRVLRSGLLLAALLSCLPAAVAVAATGARPATTRFAVGSPAVATAQQVARAHWGSDPCGGAVDIVWKRQAGDVNAVSLWSTATTAPYADPADNSDCEIDLNSAAAWDWPKLCTVIVHEYGHLTGHDHDPRAGRLMSAVYATPLAECRSTAEPRGVASRARASASRAA
jgi:hypothetical protein